MKDLTPAETRALELVVEHMRAIKERTGYGRFVLGVEIVAGRETMFDYAPTYREKPPK